MRCPLPGTLLLLGHPYLDPRSKGMFFQMFQMNFSPLLTISLPRSKTKSDLHYRWHHLPPRLLFLLKLPSPDFRFKGMFLPHGFWMTLSSIYTIFLSRKKTKFDYDTLLRSSDHLSISIWEFSPDITSPFLTFPMCLFVFHTKKSYIFLSSLNPWKSSVSSPNISDHLSNPSNTTKK